MNRIFVAILLVLVAADAPGQAPQIEQRQSQMKAIAENAKAIAETFDTRRRYDGRRMRDAAEAIRRLSGEAIAGAFPEGSFTLPSNASPAIAANRQEFLALADELARLSALLAAEFERSPDRLTDAMRMKNPTLAGNPLRRRKGEVQARTETTIPAEHLFHLMLQACTSCHARFRLRQSDQ